MKQTLQEIIDEEKKRDLEREKQRKKREQELYLEWLESEFHFISMFDTDNAGDRD